MCINAETLFLVQIIAWPAGFPVSGTEYIGGRDETGGVYLPSHLERTLKLTLYSHVIKKRVKGDGRAPPPSPGWANFSIMMECTPESGRCHSVYTLWTYLICWPDLRSHILTVISRLPETSVLSEKRRTELWVQKKIQRSFKKNFFCKYSARDQCALWKKNNRNLGSEKIQIIFLKYLYGAHHLEDLSVYLLIVGQMWGPKRFEPWI